jgi:hypothetical protein
LRVAESRWCLGSQFLPILGVKWCPYGDLAITVKEYRVVGSSTQSGNTDFRGRQGPAALSGRAIAPRNDRPIAPDAEARAAIQGHMDVGRSCRQSGNIAQRSRPATPHEDGAVAPESCGVKSIRRDLDVAQTGRKRWDFELPAGIPSPSHDLPITSEGKGVAAPRCDRVVGF